MKGASNGDQTEVGRETIEIAIIVQQAVPALNAEGRDDEVGGRANCDSMSSERPIVSRRLHGDAVVEHAFDFELAHFPLDLLGVQIVARPLQNFEQDNIANDDPGEILDCLELTNGFGAGLAYLRDPDRAIDDDHLM